MNIVDRRPNPKGKSLSNRQRFLARARAEVKSAVQEALRKRKVADVGHGEKVAIPTRGIAEPNFHHSRRTGRTEHVVPGNKEYIRGDEIPRPTGGEGRGGSQGSPDGSGEDAFEFTLSKEEFLDMFFEDLELPDLVKKSLKETFAVDLQRAGYTVTGSPANLSIRRTMRNSMARRISLKRPKQSDLEALREAIDNARSRGADEEIERLLRELDRLEHRSKIIPYIDPIDVRYNRFERVPRPNTEAVMFCLMDVSGSMTEAMKDLAKRFFMLLHVFLIRRYRHVDIVFIRHTSTAEEVDEETFFYSRETGGTVVSTALEKMLEIARARYPTDRWNIYAAQASDGDNYGADSGRCVSLLGGDVLPLCQYFAYVEVGDGMGGSLTGLSRDSDLWRAYYEVAPAHPHFVMRRVSDPSQIFSVFHELFARGVSVPDSVALRLEATTPLFSGPNWDYSGLRRVYDAIERIALDEIGLDVYPVQIEVITSEQMLDAYASVGLPLMYRHWSFGKRFAYHETLYRKGLQGLAYEIVINSNPCICYIMEENSMTMQTLVMAHAAFGHNHFFKNNYLFRQWTDANGILDYLSFARDYVQKCEERHGAEAVERVLDAAHALKDHGVNRYAHRTKPNLAEERRRAEEWRAHFEATYNDLWRTVPGAGKDKEDSGDEEARLQEIKRELGLPEENLLYMIEKRAPRLEDWQRELVRIVRLVSQYFYPQKQTQMMNEGCATFVHYEIMRRLHDKGLITEGSMLEFLHSHSSVVFQPEFDDPRFSGLNPYALGFAMMSDIRRICEEPTAEDREWFPDIAGSGDGFGVLRHAWANYRDESFVLQHLSPAMIRRFRLFHVSDDSTKPALRVEAIHDDVGYRKIRSALSRQYDLSRREPDIQVVDVDLRGDRCLILAHYVHNGVLLEEQSCRAVIRHTATLWGYSVKLLEIDAATDKTLKTYEVAPPS